MKNYLKYIGISACAMFLSCEPEFDNQVQENDIYVSGDADFSNFVSVGNSLTSGYADNALYIQGQENSFPNIMATKFELVGGGEFKQPMMEDNLGGLLLSGQQITKNRLVLSVTTGSPSPAILAGSPQTEITNKLSGPFNNMGVPGAKSYHLVAPGYGNVAGIDSGQANPYFARFASSESASVIEDAASQNPSFFSLWIGNNDILSFATSGGIGVDQAGNLDPSTYGPNDITDPNVFASVYNDLLNALNANASGGVVFNIPDVTNIPFFTTVPNNALALEAAQAQGLTGFFQAFAGIATQALIQQGVPAAQAQALASQYAIEFSEGPNRFLISVEPSQQNPFGFRQMTKEELLVLTIDQAALQNDGYGSVALTPEVMQVLGILQQGGTPTPQQAMLVLDAVNPIEDKDALDTDEIAMVQTAKESFNATIEGLAQANGLAFVDVDELMKEVSSTGIVYESGIMTSTFVTGGAFSLDGVHLTPRGYAFIASEAIRSINNTYGSTVPTVNIGNFGTVTFSDDVQ